MFMGLFDVWRRYERIPIISNQNESTENLEHIFTNDKRQNENIVATHTRRALQFSPKVTEQNQQQLVIGASVYRYIKSMLASVTNAISHL